MPWFVGRKVVTDDAITWMVIGPGHETEEQASEAAFALTVDETPAEHAIGIIEAEDSEVALRAFQRR